MVGWNRAAGAEVAAPTTTPAQPIPTTFIEGTIRAGVASTAQALPTPMASLPAASPTAQATAAPTGQQATQVRGTPSAQPQPTATSQPAKEFADLGEPLESLGLLLTAQRVYRDEGNCFGCLMVDFGLVNKTADQLIFSIADDRFYIEISSGRIWVGNLFAGNTGLETFRLEPNSRYNFSVAFKPRGSSTVLMYSAFTSAISDSSVAYYTIGVNDFGRISQAKWRVPVAH